MAEKNGAGDFLAGFLVGALVGAAAALLFAPMSGEETRVMIREKGVELGHRADEMSAEARKRAEELQLQAKERAEALQDRVKVAVEEGKATATKTKEDLLAQVGQAEAVEDTPPTEA
ncbi:MAG: YtxH domain-containing protein [Anaerolineae bacterium]|jgi:gas vesicle protein